MQVERYVYYRSLGLSRVKRKKITHRKVIFLLREQQVNQVKMIIECLSLLKSHSIFNIYVSTKCVIIRPRQELQFFAVLFVEYTPLLQIPSIFGLTSPELFLNTKRDLFYS